MNNFIFSDLWYSAVFGNLNPSSALDLFPGNLEFLVDGALTPLGTGSGNPNGFAAGFQFPEGRHVEQWQLVDDLSVTRGNHDFKMGVNFKRDDVSDFTAAENTLYPEVDTTLFGFANDQIAPPGCNHGVGKLAAAAYFTTLRPRSNNPSPSIASACTSRTSIASPPS